MACRICLVFVLSMVIVMDQSVMASDADDIKRDLDTIAMSNPFLQSILNNIEAKFEKFQEEEEGAESEAEKADKLARINEKRNMWRARLDRLEKVVAGLETYKNDEDETDAVLKGLSGSIMDDMNNDVKIIQDDIMEMRALLDTSINGVDTVLTSVKESAVSRNVQVAGVVLYGGVASACTFDTDCILSKSECRQGMCQCDPGLSFDSLRNVCAKDCPGYGRTYQFTKNKIISNFNNIELTEKSLAECKQECERDDIGFLCRSIDYFPRWKKCYLSEHTQADVPDSSWVYNGAGVHLQRDCSYTE